MKSLFEQLGSTYREENGYLIPNLTLPDEEQVEIGLWGQRHLRYIKQHHKVRYVNLLTSGKLNEHLADIDNQAEDMFFRLVKQMADREGVTEQLKKDNQMEWVARILHHPRCLRRFPTQVLSIHAAYFAGASCQEDKAYNLQRVWATYCGLKHIRQLRRPCWRKG